MFRSSTYYNLICISYDCATLALMTWVHHPLSGNKVRNYLLSAITVDMFDHISELSNGDYSCLYFGHWFWWRILALSSMLFKTWICLRNISSPIVTISCCALQEIVTFKWVIGVNFCLQKHIFSHTDSQIVLASHFLYQYVHWTVLQMASIIIHRHFGRLWSLRSPAFVYNSLVRLVFFQFSVISILLNVNNIIIQDDENYTNFHNFLIKWCKVYFLFSSSSE